MGITGDWDRRISRRTLLKTGGSFAAGLTLAGIAGGPAFGQAIFPDDPFTLGVASGDPSPTGVVLWTRLAPEPARRRRRHAVRAVRGASTSSPRTRTSTRSSARGARSRCPTRRTAPAPRSRASGPSTSTTTASGPAPGSAPSAAPARGRTATRWSAASRSRSCRARTTPRATSRRTTRSPRSEDIETVIFLGDYIYEGRNSAVRTHEPQKTIQTLDDYRIRHGQYKTDPSLQRAHAAHPWLITWDDHEFANNYADDDLDPDPAGGLATVLARRAAAYRAFWEHMPLARARKPVGPRPAALPPLPVGPDGHVQRAGRAPVPLGPDRHLRPARSLRLLRRAPRPVAHHARRRAARLAARGPGRHEGALERPRAADGVRPAQRRADATRRGSAAPAPTTGRATSPSASGSSTGRSSTRRRTSSC